MAKKIFLIDAASVKNLFAGLFATEFGDWQLEMPELKMLFSSINRDYVPGFVMKMKKQSTMQERYFLYSPLQQVICLMEEGEIFNIAPLEEEYSVVGVFGKVKSLYPAQMEVWAEMPETPCLKPEKAMDNIKAFVATGELQVKIAYFQSGGYKVKAGSIGGKPCWIMRKENSKAFVVDVATSEVTFTSLQGKKVKFFTPNITVEIGDFAFNGANFIKK